MSNNLSSHDKRLTPKEIAAEFRERDGIIVSEQFVRFMLRAGVRRIGMYARFADVVAWWEANPDFSPRGNARRARVQKNDIGLV